MGPDSSKSFIVRENDSISTVEERGTVMISLKRTVLAVIMFSLPCLLIIAAPGSDAAMDLSSSTGTFMTTVLVLVMSILGLGLVVSWTNTPKKTAEDIEGIPEDLVGDVAVAAAAGIEASDGGSAAVEEPVSEIPAEEPVEEPVEENAEVPGEGVAAAAAAGVAAGAVAAAVAAEDEKPEEPVEEVPEEPVEEVLDAPADEIVEEPVEEVAEAPAEEIIEEPVEEPVEVAEEPTAEAESNGSAGSAAADAVGAAAGAAGSAAGGVAEGVIAGAAVAGAAAAGIAVGAAVADSSKEEEEEEEDVDVGDIDDEYYLAEKDLMDFSMTPEEVVRRAAWNKKLRCRIDYGDHKIPYAYVTAKVAVYVGKHADGATKAALEEEGWAILEFEEKDITDGKAQADEIQALVKSRLPKKKRKSKK